MSIAADARAKGAWYRREFNKCVLAAHSTNITDRPNSGEQAGLDAGTIYVR